MDTGSSDPFGNALLEYYQTGTGTHIVERIDGDIGTFATGKYFDDFHDWPKLDRMAMDFVRGKCLDIGCGAGRHSLFLQQKGIDVLATDKSPTAIEVCKQRGIRKCSATSVEELVMSDAVRDFSPINTVLMLGHNIGLLGNRHLSKIILNNLYTLTTDDAVLVGTCRDPYKTDDPSNISYHQINIAQGRMAGQIRLRVRHGEDTGEWFDYLFMSKKELEDIISGTNWNIVDFIWDDASYLVVLRKL